MRRLLKIAFAAGVAALAVRLIGRLLYGADDDPSGGQGVDGGEAQRAPADAGGTSANDGPSRDELYQEAARLDIKGRSKMNKQELQEAVEAAKTGGSS